MAREHIAGVRQRWQTLDDGLDRPADEIAAGKGGNILLDSEIDLIRDGDISANVDMQPGDILIIPEAWF